MTTLSDDTLQTLQHEAERLLGRCLLRLQQYERKIKAIMSHHEVSGSASVRASRIAGTARKTLGSLVGDLLGSYVVTNEIGTFLEATTNSPEDVPSVSMRMWVELSDADYARTKNELEEFVILRNNLVHHFIDQHDLGTLDGCRAAHDALADAYSRVDQHFEQLQEWVEGTAHASLALTGFMQSDVGRDLVFNGISPDGTVNWPFADIVRVLREAAGELAVDGWVSIDEASRWIAERHPEQLPLKYECKSWRQVVHESRAFELRYREIDGKRAAWYRKKESSAN